MVITLDYKMVLSDRASSKIWWVGRVIIYYCLNILYSARGEGRAERVRENNPSHIKEMDQMIDHGIFFFILLFCFIALVVRHGYTL